MKIAHVCPFYTPAIGGVKQVVEELSERQIHAGHEVHVYTSNWDKNNKIRKENEIIRGVHVHRCNTLFKVANFVSFWPSMVKKLIKEKPDIIHSHVFGHPHFFLSALVAKRLGIPHVHTTHCPWTDAHRSLMGNIGLTISYNVFSRWALHNANKIIAITPWEYKFIKKYGGKPDCIVHLPNGMDKLFFKRLKNNDFKKKYKIKGKIVLFFGRLNIVKAPDKVVDMAKKILKKRNDVTFIIRGPDEGLKKLVKKKIAGIKQILLLDEIRDKKEIIKMYQAADIFVLPSYREGLPLTLFEAMAAGLPVVATPVNGVPFEIKNLENGFLVKYGEWKKFSEKIELLLNDSELRKKISKNNLKKARNYKWDIISKKTLDLYKSLL